MKRNGVFFDEKIILLAENFGGYVRVFFEELIKVDRGAKSAFKGNISDVFIRSFNKS